MPPQITPTLFIGLGTTGAQILGYLQEMIYEEYLTDSFPMIQMVSIITAGGDRQCLKYGQAAKNALHITVPKMQVVQDTLSQSNTEYQKGLKEWFVDGLYDFPGFEQGSCNIRAVGKLHLWENYATILKLIKAAALSFMSQKARNDANRMIHRLLTGADTQPATSYIASAPNGQVANVYVMGSLCGGTCSGMAPEFGFLLKNDASIRAIIKQIIGVFTIPCESQANDPVNLVLSRNAYAAMTEMNYYFQSTRYRSAIQMPDGEKIQPGVAPYDYIYMLSPANMHRNAFVTQANAYDHDALLQMIAMSLFLDVSMGTYLQKESIRVNLRSATPQPGLPDLREKKPRVYCSFGCASITYPKYRLARAAACTKAMEVIEQWINDKRIDTVVIGNLANATFNKFKDEIVPLLGSRDGANSIKNGIHQACLAARQIKQYDAAGMQMRMNYLPDKNDTLQSRFAEGGEFRRLVQTQYTLVADKIDALINDFATQSRTSALNRLSIPAILQALGSLRKLFEQQEKKLEKAGRELTLELKLIDPLFHKLKDLEQDPWLTIFLLKARALDERKDQILQAYERLCYRLADRLLMQYQLVAVRRAMDAIDDQTTRYNDLERKIRQFYDPRVKGNNASTSGTLGMFYNAMVSSLGKTDANMRYLYSLRKKNAEEEIAHILSQYSPTDPENLVCRSILAGYENANQLPEIDAQLLASGDATDYAVDKSNIALAEKMIEKLTVHYIEKLQANFNILDTATSQSNWDAMMEQLIDYASPYLEFDGYYATNRCIPPQGKLRKSLFAPADNVGELQSKIGGRLGADWDQIPLSANDHRMIFYCEEPYFSTTFMEAYQSSKKVYEDNRSRNMTIGLWTHREFPPDLSRIERMEYLNFVLENIVPIMSDAHDEINIPLFKYRKPETRSLPYIEMEFHKGGLPLQVDIGDAASYDQVLANGHQKDFITFLEKRIVDCARCMGQPWFNDRCLNLLNSLRGNRQERQARINLDDAEGRKLVERENRLEAFHQYFSYKAWNSIPEDKVKEVLNNYPWLSV